MSQRVFITGAAGFIGAHLAHRLLDEGWEVLGLDNMNDYYSVALKDHRLAGLTARDGFRFVKADLVDHDRVEALIEEFDPHNIVHLAAQAGVRYSIDHPRSYVDSNLSGFLTILEAARHQIENGRSLRHLVYASSSSVYGKNQKTPYSVADPVDSPVSLYAATKRANELMASSYSHLYTIPCTGLRFFTVYGPAGRPDMAYFKFAEKAVRGEAIPIYNNGDLRRDFTYIDDVTEAVGVIMGTPPAPGADGLHKVYNIGNSHPETLLHFVDTLESALMGHGIISEPIAKDLLPMQPGDVYQTYADMEETEAVFGVHPTTTLTEGLERFAAWYADYEAN